MDTYRYEEISERIELDILENRYPVGTRLPSVRILKNKYACSISTILKAYDYLMAKGLVRSIPKSGFFACEKPAFNDGSFALQTNPVLIRDAVFESHLALITADRKHRHGISTFNVAAPNDLLVPQKLLLRTMQQVIRSEGTNLLRYYPSNGADGLKTAIVKRAALYNTSFNAAELIITDGALQALYIALAAVTTPGDLIAIESPCVFSILEVSRTLKLKLIEIPVHFKHGFDVQFLHQVVADRPVKAIVLTPNFHNPTGTLLSDVAKKAILDIAIAKQIPIIENDIYGDLNFSGHRPGNIKQWDVHGLVMTYASYSKTLAPGIRLGWLSPGRFFKEAEQLKYALGSTVSPIYQESLIRLLENSSYDRHIRKLRLQLAAQCDKTQHFIRNFFPEATTATAPQGGYSLWVKMPDMLNMQQFYEACTAAAIRFTPGYAFTFRSDFNRHFRLVFADPYTQQRELALKKIAELSAKLIRSI